MSILTVTDVPDEIVAKLQRRAAAHGQSVEEEARQVLQDSLALDDAEGFKAHLLSTEFTIEDDLPLPPRTLWPPRDINL